MVETSADRQVVVALILFISGIGWGLCHLYMIIRNKSQAAWQPKVPITLPFPSAIGR